MFLLWHPSLTAINLSYTFPILETSATALCGTTGIWITYSLPCFHLPKYVWCRVTTLTKRQLTVTKHCHKDGGRKKNSAVTMWHTVALPGCSWSWWSRRELRDVRIESNIPYLHPGVYRALSLGFWYMVFDGRQIRMPFDISICIYTYIYIYIHIYNLR